MDFDFLPIIDRNQYRKNQDFKVILGISGGVDSSVSAFLLQRLGYQVECLFMKNWEEDDNTEYCTAAQDLEDAQKVCNKLGLKLHKINFATEYWDLVFEDFISEFKAGRTPNPDILCNKEIKFKAFLDYAINELDADYIATGHYVRKALAIDNSVTNYHTQDPNGSLLLRGIDNNKDQSYFLYSLSPQQISKSIFPIGELKKPQVRLIANHLGLENAKKKDSTGICFIGERKFKDFLARYIPATPGKIIDLKGNIIGDHHGAMYYTIGQRKGLGIGGTKNSNDLPWYVAKKDIVNNLLIVAQGHNSPELYAKGFFAIKTNLILNQQQIQNLFTNDGLLLTVKIRYRSIDVAATLTNYDKQQIKVIFSQPQLAVTPGQSAVYYLDDVCIGGSIIDREIVD